MHLVRVRGCVGLFNVWVSSFTYFLSLILYLVSFSLPDWIVNNLLPMKFGLWRLCDIQILGYDRCGDWTDRSYPTNLTSTTFVGPPDFIRTSQSLEIVAFVFYVIAGFLLIAGLCQRSLALLFFAASMSMFITVIFGGATLSLFAGHGRWTNGGRLSFAWWLAFSALLLGLVSSLSLFILSFYIQPRIEINNAQPKIMGMDGKIPLPPRSLGLEDEMLSGYI